MIGAIRTKETLRRSRRTPFEGLPARPVEKTEANIPAGQEHILQQADGKKRFVQVVMELSRAFALCAASDEATAIRDDVSFFQAIQAALNKQSPNGKKTPEQIDAARPRPY